MMLSKIAEMLRLFSRDAHPISKKIHNHYVARHPSFFKNRIFPPNSRGLYRPPRDGWPRPEVLIANNSAMIFALACLRDHSKGAHPDVKLFIPPFWMENIHEDNYGLLWGQTLAGMPWYVREEFKRIYPHHRDEERLTWKQYIELRDYIKEELVRLGVDLYEGTPKIVRLSNGSYSILGMGEPIIRPHNTFFYNAFRQFRVEHELGEHLPKQSHTLLYQLPSFQVPKQIIIVGAGESTKWLCQHFPKTSFLCIKFENEPEIPLYRGEKPPKNIKLYLASEDFDSNLKQPFRIAPYNKNQYRVISPIGEVIFTGEFFTAMGFRNNIKVTDQVPNQNKFLFPAIDDFGWIAAETLPAGGLMEATLRLAGLTGNLEFAKETFCYHVKNFLEHMKKGLAKKGVSITPEYIKILRRNAQQELSEGSAPELFINIHLKSYQEYKSAIKEIVDDNELTKLEKQLWQYMEIDPTRSKRYNALIAPSSSDVSYKK